MAGSLLIVQDLLGLTGSTGPVALSEIHAAAERWSCRQPAPFHRTDGRKSRLALISSAVNWLRFLGQMESSADPPAGYAHILQEFADYLRVERGSTEQSIRRRSIYVRDFLSRFCPNGCLSDITVADLDEAVARKGRDDGYTRRSVQSYADALRSFIRYGGDRGYCSQRLAAAHHLDSRLPARKPADWASLGRRAASAGSSRKRQPKRQSAIARFCYC